jgi:hypothetical protein
VADVLRRRITDGDLPPGSRLSEEQLVQVLRVSRNTLRESFRLLAHEGLLVHELHRGVFVRVLDEDDLVDLYRCDGRSRARSSGRCRRSTAVRCSRCATTWRRRSGPSRTGTGGRSARRTCASTPTSSGSPAAVGSTR